MFFWLKASLAAPNTTISSGRVGDGRFKAFQVGREHRIAHIRCGVRCRAMTSALSAICGTHLGLTKLVTSISLQARLLQALHQLDFDGRRHGLLFVLQPVARADINEAHLGGMTSCNNSLRGRFKRFSN